MSSRAILRQLPMRLATGAFMLNSGFDKLNADKEKAEQLQGFAASTYPVIGKLDPQQFTKLLACSEIAAGTALLNPAVPALVAGLGLSVFTCGLLGLYLKTPGMRKEGSIWPTEQGISLAKDVWLLGIGMSLAIDDLTERSEHR